MNIGDAKHKLESCLDKWRSDPVAFVYDLWGEELLYPYEMEWFQQDALYSFRDNKDTAMGASKGVGKSCTMSWAGWWSLTCFYNMNLFCTSVSESNLKTGLWKELAVWRDRAPILSDLFHWTKTRISLRERPETHFAEALTWAKSSDENTIVQVFSGKHARNIGFLMDESNEYPQAAVESAQAIHSGARFSRTMQAGNTTNRSGPLWNAFNGLRKFYHCIHITGDPKDPKRSRIANLEENERMIEKYGRDHAYVQINVLGIFPTESQRGLVSSAELMLAWEREEPLDDEIRRYRPRIGVDMARFGGDDTVVFPRWGNVLYPPVELKNKRTEEIVATIVGMAGQFFKRENPLVLLDGTGGFSAGVADSLRQLGVPNTEIHFAAKAGRDDRYPNMRAEMWDTMAQAVKKNMITSRAFTSPSDLILKKLGEEFDATTYEIKKGKIQLMEKELIKKALGRSPDIGDALALTYAYPDTLQLSKREVAAKPRSGLNFLDYDPIDLLEEM